MCGYAAVVKFEDGSSIELGGYEPNSTNHRAELLALIVALEYLRDHPQPTKIPIFSDSQYAVDGLNEHWVDKWRNHDWLNAKGKPVINQDIWEQLDSLRLVPATFYHLRGHTDALGKKGREAQAKNLARFGADTELHNQGNLAADRAADRFRLKMINPNTVTRSPRPACRTNSARRRPRPPVAARLSRSRIRRTSLPARTAVWA